MTYAHLWGWTLLAWFVEWLCLGLLAMRESPNKKTNIWPIAVALWLVTTILFHGLWLLLAK